jgi:hypothetical protein
LPYKPRPAWEVPRHWLHAIHPGHGHDLEAMRRTVGLLRELIAAGWEPIAGVRVTPEPIRVERYGAGRRIYLVLHNPTQQPASARVQLAPASLGSRDFTASLQPAGRNVELNRSCLEIPLAARETVVVVLRRP